MAKPVMISVSGIRGIVGEGLSPELIVNYAAAVGTYFGPGKVMVGRDSRVTGEMVKHAVFSALMSVGCSPVDLGVCSTPTVEMAVKNSDAVGGVIVTASHNPANWNALKLLSHEGVFLTADEGTQVKSIVENGQYKFAKYDAVGQLSSQTNATEKHLQAILDLPFIDVDAIRKRQFKVVYDCVNGAGGTILPQLFEALGCQAVALNPEPTGLFAHNPEPRPENLMDICEAVKQNQAEVGFAVDPDVDRLAIVSDQGVFIGEENTITLMTQFMLSIKKGPVAVNLSTTRAVEDVAQAADCPAYRSPVGEIHVVEKMKAVSAVIGGEGNGGVILPDLHLGRDAIVGIAMMLQYLLESGKTVTDLWQALPQYTMIKEKIEIGAANPDVIMRQIETNHASETLNLDDGIKIDYPAGWVHIRKSNTEPIIRIIAEGITKDKTQALCDSFIREIQGMM